MKNRLLLAPALAAGWAALAFPGSRAEDAPAQRKPPSVTVERAFPNLTFKRPVWLVSPPDKTDRLFVLEQDGIVSVFPNKPDAAGKKTFLDWTRKTLRYFEESGLLAMAFHPKFAENGTFYLYYSDKTSPHKQGREHVAVVSRMKVSKDDPDRADPESEVPILKIKHPYPNHNGGTLLFGPDGYLYFSMGDGGSGGDPHKNGQKLGTLLAKIIRIDVDHPSEGIEYGIPKDNPFADAKDGARSEIWAYGLRNVWRMSFDRKTGALWAGDVGQNKTEEIDVIEKGKNYGWNLKEGSRPFKKAPPDGLPKDLVDPVWEYDQDRGDRSVTGGYVYRGKKVPSLDGRYVCADYVSGRIWALDTDGKTVARSAEIAYDDAVDHALNVSSFGEDAEGELYILAFDGQIYRFKEK